MSPQTIAIFAVVLLSCFMNCSGDCMCMEGAGDFCGGSGFMGIDCTTGTLYTCTGLASKATVKTVCGSLCMPGELGKDHCMGSI